MKALLQAKEMAMQFTNDFIKMLGNQESPNTYLRWAIISAAGAALSRNAYIRFGGDRIYANQYIVLMGMPGSRKSSGPREAKKLLSQAGFNYFAPSKGRKEALWARLAKYGNTAPDEIGKDVEEEDITLEMLLGDGKRTANMYIIAQEWVDFIGQDGELITNLTNLWDNHPDWDYERTTKESILINEPTISMIGGATPSSFTSVIPAGAIGGGFMRRLILVHGEQTRKVTIPDAPCPNIGKDLVSKLQLLMSYRDQEIRLSDEAYKAVDKLYKGVHVIDDARFDTYLGVRLTHLLKLCLISACMRDSTFISIDDVIQSNTILTRAEISMPQALGHFGLARNSAAANIVLDAIKRAKKPPTLTALYKQVGADVTNLDELKKLLEMLKSLEKIKRMSIKGGGPPIYLPQAPVAEQILKSPFFDQSFLTSEEQI